MKILLCHSDPMLPARESIDLWRIIRPFRELAKHVDWQIDHQVYPIDPKLIDKDNKVETDLLVKEIERLKHYDIIWTSYFPDPVLFDVMMFIGKKFGTKIVLDMDDDIYHLPKHNSFWQTGGWKAVRGVQYMIENTPYMVTSCPNLKAEFDKHRKKKCYLLPNYIGQDYQHKSFDNGDKVVIGFFGSVTHKKDLEETGVVEALQKLMYANKNVYVGTVGAHIGAYLPKARYSHYVGKPGQAWIDEVWPNVNIDIALAPLEDTQFNRCKTNIKWLESALIPAAFVGTAIPPYGGTVEHGETGLLVPNKADDWHDALETLIKNKAYRQKLARNANRKVLRDWSIEKKWPTLKKIVEKIYADTPV